MKSEASLQGSASVLIILIFLCMSIFGVLSMVSAYSDYKLADKSARWVAEYYELDIKGEEAVLEALNSLESCTSSGDYLENAQEALTYIGWEFYETEDGSLAAYRNVTSGGEGRTQNLDIELMIYPQPDTQAGRYFDITRWRQWQEPFSYEDEGINLIF